MRVCVSALVNQQEFRVCLYSPGEKNLVQSIKSNPLKVTGLDLYMAMWDFH